MAEYVGMGTKHEAWAALAIVSAWLVVAGCSGEKTAEAAPATPAPPEVQPEAPPEPPPEPELPPHIQAFKDAQSFEDARAAVVKFGGDSFNDFDPTASVFAIWSLGGNMKWSDVVVKKNETSLPKIAKDSASERGKRMCVSGRIIEIARDPTAPRSEQLWIGGMFTSRGDIVRFFAVGSSGELVERSRAKLCGVVTGRYSYSNAAGGTAHAAQVVGMFDLPENRNSAD